ADFVERFLAHEAPRGSVLAVVGDHVSHLVNGVRERRGEAPLFETPLFLFGLDEGDAARARAVSGRRGSHLDIGATLLGLAGVAPSPCDLGLDLLGDDDAPFRSRLLYSL